MLKIKELSLRLRWFFFSYFLQSWVFYPQLTLKQLIQPDLESRFIVTSELGTGIQSVSSPSAGLQVVTQSTHLLKDCYPQLVPNPHRFKMQPPKQLDQRCMPLHPVMDTFKSTFSALSGYTETTNCLHFKTKL